MTENSSNDQAPECGRLLRRTRERLGLSEDDVAEELRLSPFQIRALEEDDWDSLPGTTYARGYLRSYARLLDLDPDQLLGGATTQELEITATGKSAAEGAPGEDADAAVSPGSRRGRPWLWVGGLAVVAVLAVYLWQPDRVSWLLTGGAGAPAYEDGEAAAPASEQSQPEAGAGESDAAHTSAAEGGDADGAYANRPLPEGWARIGLRFQERSWVDIRDARGERLVYRSFQPGREVEIQGEPPFRVYLGNGRGVRIEYAGQTITPDIEPGRLFARLVLDAPPG